MLTGSTDGECSIGEEVASSMDTLKYRRSIYAVQGEPVVQYIYEICYWH